MPLSASSLYRIVADTFGPPLAGAGFTQIDRRTWLRRSKHRIREILCFTPPGTYLGVTPMWGFSLDDVPHASYRSNYEVHWNAADTDWSFDLIYDPLSHDWHEAQARWSIPKFAEPSAAGQAAETVARWTIESTTRFFASVTTYSDLPAAFEAKRFSMQNRWGSATLAKLLPDEQLAYAFVLRRLDRRDEGRAWLEAFIKHDPLMPHTARRQLRTLFEAPLETSQC